MTPARGEIGRVRTPLRLSTAGSCGHAKSRATAAAPPGGRGEFPGNPPRLSRGLLGERKARSHGNASMPRSARREKEADHVDGYDRDDLGESTDY